MVDTDYRWILNDVRGDKALIASSPFQPGEGIYQIGGPDRCTFICGSGENAYIMYPENMPAVMPSLMHSPSKNDASWRVCFPLGCEDQVALVATPEDIRNQQYTVVFPRNGVVELHENRWIVEGMNSGHQYGPLTIRTLSERNVGRIQHGGILLTGITLQQAMSPEFYEKKYLAYLLDIFRDGLSIPGVAITKCFPTIYGGAMQLEFPSIGLN